LIVFDGNPKGKLWTKNYSWPSYSHWYSPSVVKWRWRGSNRTTDHSFGNH